MAVAGFFVIFALANPFALFVFNVGAIPFLVGSGLIAALISVSATVEDTASLVGFVVGLLLGYVTVYLGLGASTFIARLLGTGGTETMTRLLGLIVLGVGVSLVGTGAIELLPGLS